MQAEHIAVVGSGYMGGGIAQTLALAGFDVRIADVDAETAERAHQRLITQAGEYADRGLMPADAPARIGEHLQPSESIEAAVEGADYITEAVPEDTEIKRRALRRVSAAAGQEAVVATNTSAIGLQALSDVLSQAFIAAHWFNPAPFLPLVELAGSNEDALALAASILTRAGKAVVRVPDVPGFLANRLQFALYREAARVVEEGLATPEQVDLVVSNSFGYRLPFFGPFAIGDIAGLDVYAGSFGTLAEHYGERFTIPESLRERVASGDLGLKTSGGFREIDPQHRAGIEDYRDRAYAALARLRDELGTAPGL